MDAEEEPPPVDLADFTTAMNNFAKGSAVMRSLDGGSAAQTAMAPYISAGITALDTFLKAIGRPPVPAVLWCGAVQLPQAPGTLASWLAGAGYNYVHELQPVISALRTTTNAATAFSLGTTSLCDLVLDAEGYPPPVDLADFTTAMNDFVAASAIFRSDGPGSAGLAAMTPDLEAGTTALDAFLKAIGRPA